MLKTPKFVRVCNSSLLKITELSTPRPSEQNLWKRKRTWKPLPSVFVVSGTQKYLM